MVRRRFLALLFAAALIIPVSVHGANKTPPPPPDFRKLIKSVDIPNSSVVIVRMRDKGPHTYKIDDVTQLKINNAPGKFGDIKAGMVVEDYVERDNDTLDLLSLSGEGTETKTAPKPKKT
jgi:hypothetical protein